jgi:hypothetical protein
LGYPSAFFVPQYTADYLNVHLDYRDSVEEVHKNFSDPYVVLRGLYYEVRGDVTNSDFAAGQDDNDDSENEDGDSSAKKEGASKDKKDALEGGSLWDMMGDAFDDEDDEEGAGPQIVESEVVVKEGSPPLSKNVLPSSENEETDDTLDEGGDIFPTFDEDDKTTDLLTD